MTSRFNAPTASETVGADALGGPLLQLTDTGKVVEQYILSTNRINGFRVDKYVIMPNHVHMIIKKTNGKSISSDVRSFKALVTKKAGYPVWQTSYYDHIIRNSEDYSEKWKYIDENPVKWALDEYNGHRS